MMAGMDTAIEQPTITAQVRELVAEDRVPKANKEAAAVDRLCDAVDFHPDGLIAKPVQLVQWTLRERPEALMQLAARHQETLQVMALATLIDNAAVQTGLHTEQLRDAWDALSDHAKAVFPSSTGDAIEALAELAPIIPNPPQPSHLARSLLIDGQLVDYLTRGDDHE